MRPFFRSGSRPKSPPAGWILPIPAKSGSRESSPRPRIFVFLYFRPFFQVRFWSGHKPPNPRQRGGFSRSRPNRDFGNPVESPRSRAAQSGSPIPRFPAKSGIGAGLGIPEIFPDPGQSGSGKSRLFSRLNRGGRGAGDLGIRDSGFRGLDLISR
jgi:hypothetical protein